MDDLSALKSRIPSYADYGDEDSRHLSDQQIRAWVGERLASLDGRLGLSRSELAGVFEAVMTSCEFGDQRLIKALEKRILDTATLAALHHADLAIVEAGLATESIADMKAAGAHLDRIRALFRERYALIDSQSEAKTA